MPLYYVLNGVVEFRPDKHQLILSGQSNHTHTLNAPASRCLKLLLEQRPKLVRQSDFYSYVWGDEGKQVSVNTLYQNIALLRKGLKNLDERSAEAIVTVPKQGFKFSEEVGVLVVSPEGESVVEKDILLSTHPPIHTPKNYLDIFLRPAIRKNKWLNIFFIIYISTLIILLINISTKIDLLGGFKFSKLFSDYNMIKKEDGCFFYASHTNENFLPGPTVKNLTSEDFYSCQHFPYRYITMQEFSVVTSHLVCEKPIASNTKQKCIISMHMSEDGPNE